MKPKHTPGPWKVDGKFKHKVIGEYIRVAGIAPLDDGEIEIAKVWENNDAALIAAAPELLECLKWYALVFLEKDHLAHARGEECFHCKALAAIAKAEGRAK